MTRLLALVTHSLAMAFAPAFGDEKSKRIHVTAEVTQQTFTGDPTNPPQLGDRSITTVDLFDENHTKVGIGTGVCTVVTVPPLETRVQCLLSAIFEDEGQIIFGGVAPPPVVGGTAHFGILGGTEKFRKARGEVTITVLTSDLMQEATFELE